MARKPTKPKTQKTQKQIEQAMVNLSQIEKFNIDSVIEEVSQLNPNDYSEILQWMMKQTHAKIVYVAKLSNINIFIKVIANAVLNDLRNNSSRCLDSILPYIASKKPQQEEISVTNTQPELHIEVCNSLVENNLQKLIGNNEDN